MRPPLVIAAALVLAGCVGQIDGLEPAGGGATAPPGSSAPSAGMSGPPGATPPFVPPPAAAPSGPPPPPPPGASSPRSCTTLQAFGPVVRRLTRLEYDNTVRALLGTTSSPGAGFAADEKIDAFDANVGAPIAELQTEQLIEAAERLADEAVANLSRVFPCEASKAADTACLRQFVTTFGKRAFRRPLTAAEIDAYARLAETGRAQGSTGGVRIVVEAMLQSPHFLYRMEIGAPRPNAPGVLALTPHQLASRLAYFLWSSAPDDALLAAADAGTLATPQELETQARRMLASPRAAQTLAAFHLQWLGVDMLASADKDPKHYMDWNATLSAAMRAETERFALHVTADAAGSLDTLLTAPFTFADATLARLYGVTGPGQEPAASLTRVALDPAVRSGLLTHASVLAVHAKADQTSPVLRGKFIREQLFCQKPPPPPPEVNNTAPMVDPRLPTRQRFAQHRADPACASCHQLMDPIGFAFESFDGIGRFRATDAGRPVDSSGDLVSTDVDGPVTGAVDLASRVARSRQAAACYAQQWARFALARADLGGAACALEAIGTRFAGSGRNVHGLLVDLVTSDAFRFQRGGTP